MRLVCVDVAEPDMADPASDARRLCEAVAAQTGVVATLDPAVLREAQRTLRAGKWRVTAALRADAINFQLRDCNARLPPARLLDLLASDSAC